MPLHQVGMLVALVGVLWFVALCWKHDHKLLAAAAVAYLACAGAVASGEISGALADYMLWAALALGVAVAAATLMHVGLLAVPLVVIVAGSMLYMRNRPMPEEEDIPGAEVPAPVDRAAQPIPLRGVD